MISDAATFFNMLYSSEVKVEMYNLSNLILSAAHRQFKKVYSKLGFQGRQTERVFGADPGSGLTGRRLGIQDADWQAEIKT